MPAVDIAPLMDSPLWQSWEGEAGQAKRKDALRLWQDKDTSEGDRLEMLRMMQAPRAAAPSQLPQAPPPQQPARAIEPVQEGGVQRALGARTTFNELGTVPPTDVALPFQRPSVLPSQRETPLEEQTLGDERDIGEMAGTMLAPGPLKPVGGAIGAGLGEGVRQWRAGEPFAPGSMAKEAGLSFIPEVLEQTGRRVFRQFARNSPGGQMIRTDQAAREAREVPERVFQPRPADEISDAFEQVRRTGLPIDTGDIQRHLTTLSVGKQADTLNLLTALDRQHKTGGRYVQLYHDVTTGQRTTSSIGDLQNLRSVLRQEGEGLVEGSEERQLVRRLQGAVDDTIDFGLTSGSMAGNTPQIRDMLHTARRDWAQRAAADDMGSLIEQKITSSPDLSSSVFQVKTLADEMRRGRSEASRSINRALDMTQGARERFNTELRDISRLYERISIPMTDVMGINRMPVIAGTRQLIGEILLSDFGRREFRDAIIEGRGRLSVNAIATLANKVRSATKPEWTQGAPVTAPGRQQEESRQAPGGMARSTD